MCEQQNKNRDAYDKICTKQREVHTNTHNWAAPVRPVTLTGKTGQAQLAHKAIEVHAI
jgi:hypothetical protein